MKCWELLALIVTRDWIELTQNSPNVELKWKVKQPIKNVTPVQYIEAHAATTVIPFSYFERRYYYFLNLLGLRE